MSTTWKNRLQQRINDLSNLKDQLDSCIGCGCLSIKSCSLRNPDDKAGKDGDGAVFWKNR